MLSCDAVCTRLSVKEKRDFRRKKGENSEENHKKRKNYYYDFHIYAFGVFVNMKSGKLPQSKSRKEN